MNCPVVHPRERGGRTRRRLLGIAMLLAAAWLVGPAATAAEGADGPRLGRYRLYINNVTTMYFDLLEGNRYKVYDAGDNGLLGEGRYEYDPGERRVKWLTGRFVDVGYGGTFAEDEGGKVHILKMSGIAWAYNGRK